MSARKQTKLGERLGNTLVGYHVTGVMIKKVKTNLKKYIMYIVTPFNNMQTAERLQDISCKMHLYAAIRKQVQKVQKVMLLTCDWWISIHFVSFCF